MKFENVGVYNINNAIRGMRNPMNSWDRSDTPVNRGNGLEIGERDMKLAKKLISAGTPHRKFLRQIFVSVDITAPRYWWVEFDTYKVGTTTDGCSSMHTFVKNPIVPEMFAGYNENDEVFRKVVERCEELRREFNKTKNYKVWKKLICLLPQSFMQMRTVTMNYEVLLNIVTWRKNHKLAEWNFEFMEFIKSLPYAKEFFGL